MLDNLFSNLLPWWLLRNVCFKVARHSFYYVDFVSRFLAWKYEMYHKSTRCISILFHTNKHDKIKKNCVILKNISLIYNAQKFWKYLHQNIWNFNKFTDTQFIQASVILQFSSFFKNSFVSLFLCFGNFFFKLLNPFLMIHFDFSKVNDYTVW